MNLAAIDIGTNSFHLIVVKIKKDGNFEIIDREREVIRLGEGNVGDIKFINSNAANRAIAALERFKKIAESHNAKIRAVATSAVREALNKNEFIKQVYEQTGIEIEVVSGYEEARLIYLGVLKAVPVYDKQVLCIDIGGGSTEFAIGKEGNLKYATSIKLGAVRLTQRFFPDYVLNKERIKACKKWVEGELYKITKEIKNIGCELYVGSSGTIMSTGLMIYSKKNKKSVQPKILNNFTFTYKEFLEVKKTVLSGITPEERMKIKGLDEKRADIIPAGIIILDTIFEKLKIKELTISGYALREGIIIDTLQKEKRRAEQPKLCDIRFDSVMHLSESCNYDRKHCRHVAKLALRIYDQLNETLKLKNECREYLEAAAILHDIGYHISHSQHHRHSQYIILHSELLGFNETEIRIIANVARYHRKSHPKETHKEFSVLNKKNKNVVRKLAAILRLADSFDRTHSQLIADVKVKVNKEKIVFSPVIKNNATIDLEKWSFNRRKSLFEEMFGKTAEVVEE